VVGLNEAGAVVGTKDDGAVVGTKEAGGVVGTKDDGGDTGLNEDGGPVFGVPFVDGLLVSAAGGAEPDLIVGARAGRGGGCCFSSVAVDDCAVVN
jgi:hypothetical protein